MARSSGLGTANQRALANMAFTSGAFVIGGTATAVSTTISILYSVDGVIYTKTAMTNQALAVAAAYTVTGQNGAPNLTVTPPAFRTQPANTTVYYTLALNAAGTLSVWQGFYDGEPIGIDPASGLSVYGDGSIPDVPQGFTPVAVMKVASGGSAFVPGTTALTGIATFINVSVLPSADTF